MTCRFVVSCQEQNTVAAARPLVFAPTTPVLNKERLILNTAFSFDAVSDVRLKEGLFEMRLYVFTPLVCGTGIRTIFHVSCRTAKNRFLDAFSKT